MTGMRERSVPPGERNLYGGLAVIPSKAAIHVGGPVAAGSEPLSWIPDQARDDGKRWGLRSTDTARR